MLVRLLLAACCVAKAGATPNRSRSNSDLVYTPEMFGAVGDGRANDWEPIKQALAACSSAVNRMEAPPFCRVLFSKVYLSGPLIINSSYTTLEVATGATLAAELTARPSGIGCVNRMAFLSAFTRGLESPFFERLYSFNKPLQAAFIRSGKYCSLNSISAVG